MCPGLNKAAQHADMLAKPHTLGADQLIALKFQTQITLIVFVDHGSAVAAFFAHPLAK